MYRINPDQAVQKILTALRRLLKGKVDHERREEIFWSRDWRKMERSVESAIRRCPQLSDSASASDSD